MTKETPLSDKIQVNGMYDYDAPNERRRSKKGMWEDALFVKDIKKAVQRLKDELHVNEEKQRLSEESVFDEASKFAKMSQKDVNDVIDSIFGTLADDDLEDGK